MLFLYILTSKSKVRGVLHQYGKINKVHLLYLKQGNIDYARSLIDFYEYEQCKLLWEQRHEFHPPPEQELNLEEKHVMKDRLRLERILQIRNHHHKRMGRGENGRFLLEPHFHRDESPEKQYGDEEVDLEKGKNVIVKDEYDDREKESPTKGIFMGRLDLTHYQKKYKNARVFDYKADYVDGEDEYAGLKTGPYRHDIGGFGGHGSSSTQINSHRGGLKGRRIIDRGEGNEYTA